MADCPTYIHLEDARRIVLDRVKPLPATSVPLGESLGMTLADGVRCDADAPAFDRAMMDGYAVRSADVADVPVTLEVVGQIGAADGWEGQLAAGQAVQINTGAKLPAGADAVVPVEETTPAPDGRTVSVRATCRPGRHVSPRGKHAVAGQVVLERGTRLGPVEIATAAAAGADPLTVHARPSVSVLTTGDELVEPHATPVGSQVRNVNGPGLIALLKADGIQGVSLGSVGDDPAELQRCIREGLACDVLLITGGVSMGAFDHVPDVLAKLGVRFLFRKMRTKPGRPTAFGATDDGRYVFALPGNPVSAFVGYWLLVAPALAAMQGRAVRPVFDIATLDGYCEPTEDRRSFAPAKLRIEDGRLVAQTLSWAGSADPFGMATADAMVSLPAHAPAAGAGDPVETLVFNRW